MEEEKSTLKKALLINCLEKTKLCHKKEKKEKVIGLSFLFVCHGGSRKLQLREELRATLLSPLQTTRRRHKTFAYSLSAFEMHPFN